jgi:hypothetical protein
VGGYAVGFHSRPKFTHDIDIWINATVENAKLLIKVLKNFGFENINITADDLSTPNKLIQLGNEPMRIDIMTSVSGLEFDKSFKNCIVASYLDVDANLINIEDLIQNKKASGRKNDLYDIEWIEKYRK